MTETRTYLSAATITLTAAPVALLSDPPPIRDGVEIELIAPGAVVSVKTAASAGETADALRFLTPERPYVEVPSSEGQLYAVARSVPGQSVESAQVIVRPYRARSIVARELALLLTTARVSEVRGLVTAELKAPVGTDVSAEAGNLWRVPLYGVELGSAPLTVTPTGKPFGLSVPWAPAVSVEQRGVIGRQTLVVAGTDVPSGTKSFDVWAVIGSSQAVVARLTVRGE